MRIYHFAIALACAPAAAVQAATVLLGYSIEGYVASPPGDLEFVSGFDERDFDSLTEGPSHSLGNTIGQGDTAYSAAGTGNSNTGQLSVHAALQEAQGPATAAFGFAQISEQLHVSGTGTVSFSMTLAGGWDVDSLEPAGRIFLTSGMALNDFGDTGFLRLSRLDVEQFSDSFETEGVIGETLLATVDIDGDDSFSFSGSVLASLRSVAESGSASFAASLLIEASDGVSLEFDDPGFLSGSEPAPVPLPPTGLLLIGALTTAGLLRFRADRP